MVPALIAQAQSEGLEAFRGPSGAVAYLEDRTMLSWQDSANHQDFILLIGLPSEVAEENREASWASAKARADAIWQKAMQARRAYGLPPTPMTY
jgi:hypothetical protein